VRPFAHDDLVEVALVAAVVDGADEAGLTGVCASRAAGRSRSELAAWYLARRISST